MRQRVWFAAQVLFDVLAVAVFTMLAFSMASNYFDMTVWQFRVLTLVIAAWAAYMAIRGAMNLWRRFVGAGGSQKRTQSAHT